MCNTAAGTSVSAPLRKATETAEAKTCFFHIDLFVLLRDNIMIEARNIVCNINVRKSINDCTQKLP